MKFSTSKFLGSVLIFLSAGHLLTACIFETKETKPVDITIDSVEPIQAGDTLFLKGSIKGEGKVRAQVLLLKDGDNVWGSSLKLIPTDTAKSHLIIESENSVDFEASGYKIVTFADINQYTCSGVYTLKIEAGISAEGGVTGQNTSDLNFDVEGIDCDSTGIISDLDLKVDTLAAQGSNDAGSAFDLDAFTDNRLESAKEKSSSQDLYFAASEGAQQQTYFYVPSAIADSGLPPYKWAVKNSTKFAKVSADFSKVKSTLQIKKLFQNASLVSQKELVAKGDVFVVKSEKGTLGLIKIVSKSNSGAQSVIAIQGLLPKM